LTSDVSRYIRKKFSYFEKIMQNQISSIAKILDILGLFEAEGSGFTAQDISRALQMPLSSTYKYLEILVRKRFLRKEPGERVYRLGVMIYRLGMRYTPDRSFLETALRHMRILSERTNETVFLSVVQGWEAQIIERIEPAKRVKISLERGATIPMYAGAAQKVLLAYQDNDFIENLIRVKGLEEMTPHTITDPARLREELADIRKKGFAVSDSEVHSWTSAVAAPVFDGERRVIAGLGIAVPKMQDGTEDLGDLVKMVREAALEISREVGPGEE